MRTQYLYDDVTGACIAEFDENGDAQVEYTTNPQTGELISENHNGQEVYHRYDGEGNTRQATDADGSVLGEATYSAFGETLAESGNMNTTQRFRGRQRFSTDPLTSVVSRGNLDYSPPLGRGLSAERRSSLFRGPGQRQAFQAARSGQHLIAASTHVVSVAQPVVRAARGKCRFAGIVQNGGTDIVAAAGGWDFPELPLNPSLLAAQLTFVIACRATRVYFVGYKCCCGLFNSIFGQQSLKFQKQIGTEVIWETAIADGVLIKGVSIPLTKPSPGPGPSITYWFGIENEGDQRRANKTCRESFGGANLPAHPSQTKDPTLPHPGGEFPGWPPGKLSFPQVVDCF